MARGSVWAGVSPPALQVAGPGLGAHSLPGLPCIVTVVWFPGGMSVSVLQEDGGAAQALHRPPERTYDMMEGRVSPGHLLSQRIEGVYPAPAPDSGGGQGP